MRAPRSWRTRTHTHTYTSINAYGIRTDTRTHAHTHTHTHVYTHECPPPACAAHGVSGDGEDRDADGDGDGDGARGAKGRSPRPATGFAALSRPTRRRACLGALGSRARARGGGVSQAGAPVRAASARAPPPQVPGGIPAGDLRCLARSSHCRRGAPASAPAARIRGPCVLCESPVESLPISA